MVRINRFRNRILPIYHVPDRDSNDCLNEESEYFSSVNENECFELNKSEEFSSVSLDSVDESHSFTEISSIHSYCPFDENDLPPPYSSVISTLSTNVLQKKSFLRRFDLKSATFALSKRRKFGQCHHNFSYFNLNKKLSKYSFVANNNSSAPICICINGKVQVLDENCIEDIVQMFPSLSLSPTTPSTSKICSKYFGNGINDKNPQNLIYSLSSWLSKNDKEKFDSLNGLNLIRTIRTKSTAENNTSSSALVLRTTTPRRRNTVARGDLTRTDFGRRRNHYGISQCVPLIEKTQVDENCLATSAVLQAFDSAKFSLTVQKTNVSSSSAFLDEFKGLSIAGNTRVELLPEQVVTQEAISTFPEVAPAPPPTSPIKNPFCDFLQENDKNDFNFQHSITSGIEFTRLKL